MFSKIITSLLIAIVLVPMAHACTAFVVYRNGLALAGNNEDFWETDTKIWYIPKEGSNRGVAGKLGRVYFGFDDFFAQGGMNEAGLFFDGFATAENKLKNLDNRPRFEGNMTDYVMANCKTVSEVVAVFEKHELSFLTNAMLMFGDQYGDSVIIEGDDLLRIKGDHQVVTNFYQSLTPADECPCPRYEAAVQALGKGVAVSVESCRDVLAATRQNRGAPTQYSNVYDLKNGLVYLYHFHNFEEVVRIDLKEELEKGAHEIDLPSLFSENEQFDTFREEQEKRKQAIRDQVEARKATGIEPSGFHEFTGTYSFDVGQKEKVDVSFLLEGDQFYAVSEADNEQDPIYPEAKDLFFRIDDNGSQTYLFRRNGNKKVIGVTVEISGQKYHGDKKDADQ